MKSKKRLVIVLLLLAFVGGITFLCVSRWKAWFYNPQELSYVPPTVPDRVLLTMAPSASQHYRRVSWRCDSVLTTAALELISVAKGDTLFLPAQGRMVVTRSGKQAYYERTFPVDSGMYVYRVHNDSVASPYRSFCVKKDSAMKILVLGDLQDENPEPFANILQEIVMRHPDVDVCAFTGDVIERPTDEYWDVWFASVASVAGSIPVVACPGNHEHVKGWRRQLDPRWLSAFGESKEVDANEGNAIYDWGCVRWVSLNTDVSFHIYQLYAQKISLLKQNVLDADDAWKVMMFHHPYYPASLGRRSSMLRWVFNSFLQQQGVHLVLNGHDHVYARRITQHDNQLMAPIYMVCNSSAKHYLANCDASFDRMACAHRFYSLLTVTPDTLLVETYSADNHVLYDAFLCRKTPQGVVVEDNNPHSPEWLDVPNVYWRESKQKERECFLKKRELRF